MIWPSERIASERRERVLPMPLVEGMSRDSSSASRLVFGGTETQYLGTDADVGVSDLEELLIEHETCATEVSSEQQRVAAELEAALDRGRIEGREATVAEFEQRLAEVRLQVKQVCGDFDQERERYFAVVESEVVTLAQAIAARVLQREVKLDSMLLRDVVKVALGRLMDMNGTVLRVPAEDVTRWHDLMSNNFGTTVQVIEDLNLVAGECVLETNVGRIELGVAVQLEEIGQDFSDLLQQRPV